MIDLDPQAHLSAIHGGVRGKIELSVFSYFKDSTPLLSLEIQWPGIGSLIPAHAELIKVDSIFGKGPNLLNKLNQGIEELNTGRTILIECESVITENVAVAEVRRSVAIFFRIRHQAAARKTMSH